MYHNPSRKQLEQELEGRAAVWSPEVLAAYYTEHIEAYHRLAENEPDPDFAVQLELQAVKYEAYLNNLQVEA